MLVRAAAELGRSAVSVTRLSFGSSAIAEEDVDDAQAAAAVAAAWTTGIRYFDTAPFYGLGLGERRLGAALRDRPRASFTVSTKVGRLLDPDGGWSWDFSGDGVRRSLDQSLDRLGLDAVDVVLIHDPEDHWQQAVDEAYPVLHDLRRQGVVRAIGVGMNRSAMLTDFVQRCELDCVLVAGRWTLLDREAETALLPACLSRGVSVIAAGVFNSGLLADPDAADARYDYRPVDDAIRRRAQLLRAELAELGAPLTAAALQFPATHPAVATVLVGCRSAGEVEQNAAMFELPLPAEALGA
jgi:D-threo-aldose 1-dehydrogenase